MPKRPPAPPASPSGSRTTRSGWLSGEPLSRRAHLVLGLALPMLLTLVNAVRLSGFTIDDAFISFRYADNLARGAGLVYNLGERVEGYTNFLWTVLLAIGSLLGARPEITAKVLGTLAACASLVPVYLLAERLRPMRWAPCVATWLCASSFPLTGYAVFGLETPLFVLLLLTATELFFREHEREEGLPWSGLLFALATLTRPEAPLILLLLYIWQGSSPLHRKSLVRVLLFAAPVVVHLAFRRFYYGAFVPNTLAAKTGNFTQQLAGGSDYLRRYVAHAGPLLWLGIGAIAIAVVRRRRDGIAIGAIAFTWGLYVVLVGGDWMPFFRFVAPAEPFAFVLVDVAARAIFERRERAAALAVSAFAALMLVHRARSWSEARRFIFEKEKAFWDDVPGRTAEWIVKHDKPGPVVIADIGYVGYRTGLPIVDMLGLLSPEIAKLPGGYTNKTGEGFMDAVFAKDPRYFVIISSTVDCKSGGPPSSRAALADGRFQSGFRLAETIRIGTGGAWCIFEKKDAPK